MKPVGLESFVDETETMEEVPLWLISFADIMALMLTFFVLLYSMSTPKQEKYSQLSESVEEGLINYPTLPQMAGRSPEEAIDKIKTLKGLDLDYVTGLLNNYFKAHNLHEKVILLKTKTQIMIALPGDLAFQPGQSQLSAEAKLTLSSLNNVLNKMPNRIEVVGHADPTPITGANENNNNWTLSLSRAQAVANFLKQRGYKKNITAHGVSSGHFEAIPRTLPEETQNALARRVDIVLKSDKGRKTPSF